MIQTRYAHERGQGGGGGWLDSRHTFSFANYFDPNHMGFSHLRVINEDFVAPGSGFGTHPHRDMEILSYVLSGQIAHKDSIGNVKTLSAGEFQIMSAGAGIAHSEYNPSSTDELHFYQIWIVPNQKGVNPRYEQKEFAPKEGATLLLSPNADENSFKIYQDMKLFRYQYKANSTEEIKLDANRKYWLQVVKGELSVNDTKLKTSDALAITEESALHIDTFSEVEFLLFDLV
ncbi:pirin family protein [Campylobacter sp. MOP7]|uniref:pirin family protein n=1 Tax=Campylobacter canis TaxID=3378588 RepID=UPI00387EC885